MSPRLPLRSAQQLGLVAALCAIALTTLVLWSTCWVSTHPYEVSFTGFYLLRLGLLALLTSACIAAFVLGVLRQRRSRALQRWSTAALATALTLIALEGAFMFVPRSHNVGYTLAAQVWSRYYWRDRNSLDYRDREHVAVPGKKLVFAVGDSFTAGAGIADAAARFTDRLEAEHPELHVLNLGRSASDTIDELQRLESHPLVPDCVVLQYYPNDIEGALRSVGWQLPAFEPYGDLPGPVRSLVAGSFLLDYVYWCFPHSDGAAYAAMLDRAMADEAVMRRHLADLDRFADYAQQHRIPLVVVLFPLLFDLDRCRAELDRVEAEFAGRGVPVVDVADLVRDLPVSERTANGHDAHASARVHELVAQALGRVLAGG